MKLIVKMAVMTVFVPTLYMSTALAQSDDLLSILESDSSEGMVQEKQELTVQVQKLLGAPTAEQNIFLGFLAQDKYDQALFQWSSAFGNSEFANSANGKALFGYLLYKNKLQINGIETLFIADDPQTIVPEIRRVWRLVAPAEDDVWKYVRIDWKPAWTEFFDRSTEVQVLSHKMFDVSDSDAIIELLKKSKLKSEARARLEWQMALSLALSGDVGKAGKVLALLLQKDDHLISKSLIRLTAARLLYENGYLDASIKYYKLIPQSSEYWFVAQEELAWAYIRKAEPQNTLAITQTLMNKAFAPHIGPETVFLTALAGLKVCDYPMVVNSINDFRHRFRARTAQLLSIANKEQPEVFEQLRAKLSNGRVKLLELGPLASKVPRYVSRDEVLLGLIEREDRLQTEAETAKSLYGKSVSGGSAKVGYQAQFAELRNQILGRYEMARGATIDLLATRAKEETQEIHKILQKMHIVEAEVIQRLQLAEQTIKATQNQKLDIKMGSTGSKAKDTLRFPFEGETWFDELANFKVDVKKGCQAKASEAK